MTEKLTYGQHLTLVAHVPELANLLVKNYLRSTKSQPLSKQEIKQLIILGSGNAVTAQYILENNLLVDNTHRVEIAANHKSVAQHLLNSGERLYGFQLAKLGCNFVSLAEQILENKALCQKLSGADLETLSAKHSAIKVLILFKYVPLSFGNLTSAVLHSVYLDLPKPPKTLLLPLYTPLHASELIQVMDVSPATERFIATLPELNDKLLEEGFIPGARLNAEHSRSLVKNADFVEKLRVKELLVLCKNDFETAEIIFNHPSIKKELMAYSCDLLDFGLQHLGIGFIILQDSNLYLKLDEKHLLKLVAARVELAKYCVENEALRNHVGVKGLLKLIKYPCVAFSLMKLFNTQMAPELQEAITHKNQRYFQIKQRVQELLKTRPKP